MIWSGYEFQQPGVDPRHAKPALDSAYYVAWSDAILAGTDGEGRFNGAFYRAPLYPYLISLLRGPLGAGLEAIRWLQLAAALAATALLARIGFRQAGPVAGIATAALLGAYHPWLFFSSRLLAESWAVLLLALALSWIPRHRPRWVVLCGLALGLAGLARPNLLLVAILWAVAAVYARKHGKALLLLVAVGSIVLPVTGINWQRSGHLVPVSSNGGLTLYHGNGPQAFGVYTEVHGMSAAIKIQRAEATLVASHQAGREFDPVEADRYWGRRALRQRLAHPLDSLVLGWNRVLLTAGTYEIPLEEAPALDRNPWSHATFVPFALIFALAAAGITAPRRAPGSVWTWTALAGCAAAPLIFYVSSRYRLPLAVLLTLPAGLGVVELLSGRRRALVAATAAAVFSLAVPWIAEGSLPYAQMSSAAWAHGHAGLAQACHVRAREAASEAERARWSACARDALESGRRASDSSPKLWFVEGHIAADEGRRADAEAAWMRAWRGTGEPPWRVAAAGNLAALWLADGRASSAEGLSRQALQLVPLDETCRNNLIAALISQGRAADARTEIARSRARGVRVDPQLEALIVDGDERDARR